ncbi:hypothetical protein PE067_18965 [Paracoccus sp. DMF-8]|uniref:hypothetical protein n=1 Tax=Paracoccus sp. DMF-8 TaxID=3019445 RepID=UPI0023E36E46|nr:hypothetical protein [Paracoccus sp. DMF-8]MDF3608026.1 hypothetical protein [Paracoccus sp. DMF-8]
MLGNFKFDALVEKMSRRVAGRTSRRGAIGKLGTVLAGAALVPLLPVDRRGRVSRANAAGATDGSDPRAKWQPQDHGHPVPATTGGTALLTATSATVPVGH